MPPPLILEPGEFNPEAVIFSKEEIYRVLPQRFEFAQLDGATFFDRDRAVGVAFRDITAEDWWARGHIPGKPLFPGVLMLEAAAQTAAFFVVQLRSDDTFMAFGGVDDCKFRNAVIPPARIYFMCRLVENRPRRFVGEVQAVVKGELVFEARITGLAMAR